MSRPIPRLLDRLNEPVDAASLVVFRVLFGSVVAFGALRFLWNGWVDRFFVAPRFMFKYWGFEWITVAPRPVMVAIFAALAALGVMVAAGLFYRAAIVALVVLFTYVELLDVTNYLNHYYLVSLLGVLLACMPLGRAGSLDARLRPAAAVATFPTWMLWLLRFQVGTVYVGAALAKAGSDWLLFAEPLGIWMRARTDTPLLGPWLDAPWVPLLMAWAGFLNDLLAVPLLLWRRTRPWMYAVLVVFHVLTRVFFSIGLFPLIMLMAATIFFDPAWPRRAVDPWFAERPVRRRERGPFALGRLGLALAAAFVALQLALPFRAHLYGGNVLWHEQGMRFSWRVMVREKNGDVTFRVKVPGRAREVLVRPAAYLTDYQEREMGGQPDLILKLAHRIRDDFRRAGHVAAEVRVDAWASLNGRPRARLIDPEVDLASVKDGLARAAWILPAPEGRPLRVPGTFADLLASAP